MNLFRNISIKNKITLITMLTCMVVLILLLISFTILEFTISRTALVEKVATLAEVIGTNSTAALTFNDQKSAEATLSALSAESEIVGAAIYTRDGRLFAMLSASPETLRRPAVRDRAGRRYSRETTAGSSQSPSSQLRLLRQLPGTDQKYRLGRRSHRLASTLSQLWPISIDAWGGMSFLPYRP